MIYEMVLRILFKFIYFIVYNDYKPTIIFLSLSITGYIILNKIKKNLIGRDTELAKHNMHKTYVRKILQKINESKPKKHTAYQFFFQEEWPKIRKEFKNYHYKELLQYLSLRWYIIKNNPLKLQKYEKMAVDNNSIQQIN